MNKISLTSAIGGYLLYAEARRLSPNTIAGYKIIFSALTGYFESDPPIESITSNQAKQFLISLDHLTNKSLLHYRAAMSSLWQWGTLENLVDHNIIRDVPAPKPEDRVIQPYTQDEVKAMLKALDKSYAYTRPGKRECVHSIGTAARNRAIILLLLDTGIRNSELCSLIIHNVDLKMRHILVLGKGSKERLIPMSPQSTSAIWRYLSTNRPKDVPDKDYLFVTPRGGPLDRSDLYHIIVRIGNRAGVDAADVHRFRHTFAINFLRNGGDVFSLQRILGHSNLAMCQKYLALASIDIEAAHKVASPVANWRL